MSRCDGQADLARQMADDGFERLLEGVFYLCVDSVVEGELPRLDPDQMQESADRGMARMVRGFREAMDRQGLPPCVSGVRVDQCL